MKCDTASRRRRAVAALAGLSLGALVLLTAGPAWCQGSGDEFLGNSAISIAANDTTTSCNFNTHPIVAGDYIWFNSAFVPSGPTSVPVTFYVQNQIISFNAVYNGVTTSYVLPVPNATITFYPTAQLSCASTQFTTYWKTDDFWAGSGRTFMSGLAYQVPANFGVIVNPVTWSGSFYTDNSGASLQWTWSAAVYNPFSSAYSTLGVKSTDDTNDHCIYANSHQSGTPENLLGNIKPGGTGGGSSNYTGSRCATASVPSPVPSREATWGEIKTMHR